MVASSSVRARGARKNTPSLPQPRVASDEPVDAPWAGFQNAGPDCFWPVDEQRGSGDHPAKN